MDHEVKRWGSLIADLLIITFIVVCTMPALAGGTQVTDQDCTLYYVLVTGSGCHISIDAAEGIADVLPHQENGLYGNLAADATAAITIHDSNVAVPWKEVAATSLIYDGIAATFDENTTPRQETGVTSSMKFFTTAVKPVESEVSMNLKKPNFMNTAARVSPNSHGSTTGITADGTSYC